MVLSIVPAARLAVLLKYAQAAFEIQITVKRHDSGQAVHETPEQGWLDPAGKREPVDAAELSPDVLRVA